MEQTQQFTGFPQDDEFSLMQGDNGAANLDIFYSCQYVQNETSNIDLGKTQKSSFAPLEHTPVLEASLTGTVYHNSVAIQTFTVHAKEQFVFHDIGKTEVKAMDGSLNRDTGELCLFWNANPGVNHIVVSYEYNMEAQYNPHDLNQNDGFDYKVVKREICFKQPTFEKFFDSEEICELVKSAGTTMMWDFNTALGDTIKEKYESLYVKCVELTNILSAKGAMGYFWLTCSPEIASVFETATAGFAPISYREWSKTHEEGMGVAPFGIPEVQYRGTINARWRLYTDSEMPKDILLIGCNDEKEHPNHYGRMRIINFII